MHRGMCPAESVKKTQLTFTRQLHLLTVGQLNKNGTWFLNVLFILVYYSAVSITQGMEQATRPWQRLLIPTVLTVVVKCTWSAVDPPQTTTSRMLPSRGLLLYLLLAISSVFASPASRDIGKATLEISRGFSTTGSSNRAQKDRARSQAFAQRPHLSQRGTGAGSGSVSVAKMLPHTIQPRLVLVLLRQTVCLSFIVSFEAE